MQHFVLKAFKIVYPGFSAEETGTISEVLDFSSTSSAFGGGVAGQSGLASWEGEGCSGAGKLIFTMLGSSDGLETFGGTIISSLFSISILLLVSVELLNVACAELNGFGASLPMQRKIKITEWRGKVKKNTPIVYNGGYVHGCYPPLSIGGASLDLFARSSDGRRWQVIWLFVDKRDLRGNGRLFFILSFAHSQQLWSFHYCFGGKRVGHLNVFPVHPFMKCFL
jgi:hypothetical protein